MSKRERRCRGCGVPLGLFVLKLSNASSRDEMHDALGAMNVDLDLVRLGDLPDEDEAILYCFPRSPGCVYKTEDVP